MGHNLKNDRKNEASVKAPVKACKYAIEQSIKNNRQLHSGTP